MSISTAAGPGICMKCLCHEKRMWSQRHVSFGGRVTLINSILTALPIYFLSFFKIPDKVVDKLVNIQCRFLWGGGLEQRKIAWANWKTVCLPRDKGGLGIKDLWAFNTALLAKWKWELFQKHGDLWSKILISKYGGWRALDDTRRSSHLSSWWKGLL